MVTVVETDGGAKTTGAFGRNSIDDDLHHLVAEVTDDRAGGGNGDGSGENEDHNRNGGRRRQTSVRTGAASRQPHDQPTCS